jgi:Family of unknown function (DUF6292)
MHAEDGRIPFSKVCAWPRYRSGHSTHLFVKPEKEQNMHENSAPLMHPDPWVNLKHGYVNQAVKALSSGGLLIDCSWLDPRDATIIFSDAASHVSADKLALVWDEVTGWRRGTFVSGEQGVRTELADVSYLGGGVLPSEDDLLNRVLAGASEPRRAHRSVADLRDGLEDALLARD